MSKRKWTEEEDEQLVELVSILGQSVEAWKTIAEKHFPHRNPKQCRERYMFHLNPTVEKGPWTMSEERLLFQLQATIGNAWTDISGYLPGRSEASVKNRFYSALRRVERAHRVAQSVAGDMLAMYARASMSSAEAEHVAGIARDLAEGGSMCKAAGPAILPNLAALPTLQEQQVHLFPSRPVVPALHGAGGSEQVRSRSGRAIKSARVDSTEFEYDGIEAPALSLSAGTLGQEDGETSASYLVMPCPQGEPVDTHAACHPPAMGKRPQFEDAVINTPLTELTAALAAVRSMKRSLPADNIEGQEKDQKGSSNKKARAAAPAAQKVFQASGEQSSVSGGSSTGSSGSKERLQAMVAATGPVYAMGGKKATLSQAHPTAMGSAGFSTGVTAAVLGGSGHLQGGTERDIKEAGPGPAPAIGLVAPHLHGTRHARSKVELSWHGLHALQAASHPAMGARDGAQLDTVADFEGAKAMLEPAVEGPRDSHVAAQAQVQQRPPAPLSSVRLRPTPAHTAHETREPSAPAPLPEAIHAAMLSPLPGKNLQHAFSTMQAPGAKGAAGTPSVMAGLPSAGLLPFPGSCLKGDLRLDGMSEASFSWMVVPGGLGQVQPSKSRLPPLLSNASLGLHLSRQVPGASLLPPLGRHALPSPDARYDVLGGAGQGFTLFPPLSTSQVSPGHNPAPQAVHQQE